MRAINTIVVHCSATKHGQEFHAADIDRWHRAKGWAGIGYHYVISLDGTVETGRPLEKAGAHVEGHNANSIGICMIGGLDQNGKAVEDGFDPEQYDALFELLHELRAKYPNTRIVGHRDLSPDKDGDGKVEKHEWLKDCPTFDAPAWARSRGLDPK